MNRYKFIFEKTFTNRCVSKKIEQEVIVESEVNINQRKDLNELAYAKLIADYSYFFSNETEQGTHGWSRPQIKEFHLINNSEILE